MRRTFYEWLTSYLAEVDSRGRYGQDPGDENPKFSMATQMWQNAIAEGDWEQALTHLAMAWANAQPGPGKDALKQKIDDYAFELIQMGNDPERVTSIVSRASHGGRGRKSFIGAAKASAV